MQEAKELNVQGVRMGVMLCVRFGNDRRRIRGWDGRVSGEGIEDIIGKRN